VLQRPPPMALARILAPAILAVLASGCATVGPVALKHRETGETVRCEGYWHWTLNTGKAREQQAAQRRCVEEHERRGYVKLW
jgi:hypothetical protein